MSELADAEARVASARARMTTTVEALQAELAPDKLTELARRELNAARVARKSVGIVQRHPTAVAGIASLLVAVAGRRRIGALIARACRRPKKPAAS